MEKALFVFELDQTIWDCGKISTDQLSGPFKKNNGEIFDHAGHKIQTFPEIGKILDLILSANYSIAFTSTTSKPDCTRELTRIAGIDKYPDITIYNNENKQDQVLSLMAQTGMESQNLLYFDTQTENVRELKSLDIHTFLIPDEGLTYDTFILAMKNAGLVMDLDRLGITWGQKDF